MNDLYVACIPIFNDWHSARDIITRLQSQARTNQHRLRIVLVDDGSTEQLPFEERAQVPELTSVA